MCDLGADTWLATSAEEFRKEVSQALRRLGHQDVAMEYYVAEDRRPLDRCLSDVASCDVYVGIFAWRYGYIPKENNPEQQSLTELEYRQALATGKTCLIFVLSEDAPWLMTKMERLALDRITALRQELRSSERHVVNTFETAEELTRKVNEAVIRWEKDSGLVGKRQLTDWEAYREVVFAKHQWVPLQVIAGVSKDRGIARIPLTAVFEPQLAAPRAPLMEVPNGIRKYQELIYGTSAPAAPVEEAAGETHEPETSDETAEVEAMGPLISSNPEFVLDVLGREPTQIILGGPGSGKSTIPYYTMLRLCEAGSARDALPLHLQSVPVPFLVVLRNYVLQWVPDFVTSIVKNATEFYGATVEAESLGKLLE
jgi:hypothetical protein